MGKPNVYGVSKLLKHYLPIISLIGIGAYIYHRGHEDGMEDVCDWVDNAGDVLVKSPEGDFSITKKFETEEGA